MGACCNGTDTTLLHSSADADTLAVFTKHVSSIVVALLLQWHAMRNWLSSSDHHAVTTLVNQAQDNIAVADSS
jgi:hypothetical protein